MLSCLATLTVRRFMYDTIVNFLSNGSKLFCHDFRPGWNECVSELHAEARVALKSWVLSTLDLNMLHALLKEMSRPRGQTPRQKLSSRIMSLNFGKKCRLLITVWCPCHRILMGLVSQNILLNCGENILGTFLTVKRDDFNVSDVWLLDLMKSVMPTKHKQSMCYLLCVFLDC